MNSDITKLAKWDNENEPKWINNINWDEFEKLAAIGYTPDKIALFYRIPKIDFIYYFMLADSKLQYHYDRGILYYQAKDGISMLDDADTNVTQAQRLDKLRDQIAFCNARDKIIYGGF